ncbi:aldo/keto reductase [Pseudoxanthomonas sp. USHLN014]|uniref:aldo/keto reductase n=1 Tax=Pseudoxanthomonas sp. USHLN014 TaxID=3081297 RepID=UPI00301BCCFE
MSPIPTTRLGGQEVPVLGQGTWNMGDDPARRKAEIEALQRGIDLGLRLIDTAEMYGEGASERLVGEAIQGRRDDVFVVSKAYPQNASRSRLPQACERSLRHLGTDHIDLYLLHWRGAVPLAETVEAMQALRQAGKIRHWGVSNLDVDDMEELIDAGGTHCATDQILYNLTRRGPEYDLLPWLEERQIAAMAYSPVEQGRLKGHAALQKVARRHSASDLQVALAWVLRRQGVIAIPKAASRAHVEDNAGALSLTLTDEDLADLDRAFPPPRAKRALEML